MKSPTHIAGLSIMLAGLAFSWANAEQPQQLSDQELAAGWIQLFDGETLFGWQPATKTNWRVEDGAIVVDEGEAGLLCTTTQFSDYQLQLEFRADEKTNSGVFLHTPLRPTNPTVDCYEVNIAEKGVSPFVTGSLVGRAKGEEREAKGERREEWRLMDVTVQGERVDVKVDGNAVLAYEDPRPLRRGADWVAA